MKKSLNYTEALSKLEQLVSDLEEGEIPLDKLAKKVAEAKQYIAICEEKLRGIEKKVNEETSTL